MDLNSAAPIVGLLGLIGFAGLASLRHPVETTRAGGVIRLMGLAGISGLIGFWIPGAGAIGASGALALWNHQNPRLAMWGRLGWLFVLGIPYLILFAVDRSG